MNTWLAILVPISSGLGIIYLATLIDRSRFQIRGVVGPYFGALAVLFGLFASLTAHETWQRVGQVNGKVAVEVESLNGIWEVARLLQQDEDVTALIREYVQAETAGQIAFAASGVHEMKSAEAVHALYAFSLQGSFVKAEYQAAQGHLLNLIDNLRNARLERLQLNERHLSSTKLLALLIFGALTQAAIALCHAGNVRASIATVMLFSLASSVSIYFITALDDPESIQRLIDLSVYESALH